MTEKKKLDFGWWMGEWNGTKNQIKDLSSDLEFTMITTTYY